MVYNTFFHVSLCSVSCYAWSPLAAAPQQEEDFNGAFCPTIRLEQEKMAKKSNSATAKVNIYM